MLGINQIGFSLGGTTVDYVVQSKKYNKEWDDLQHINTLDQDKIRAEMTKWRKLCPDSEFRAIKREITITDLETCDITDINKTKEQTIIKLKESINVIRDFKI